MIGPSGHRIQQVQEREIRPGFSFKYFVSCTNPESRAILNFKVFHAKNFYAKLGIICLACNLFGYVIEF